MDRKAVWVGLLLGITACTYPITAQLGEVTPTAEPGTATATIELTTKPAIATPTHPAINPPQPESPALLSIRMFSDTTGWGVSETQLLRTLDGGESWIQVTPENLINSGLSLQAFFFDLEYAWVLAPDLDNYPYAGDLFRTINGGKSWEATEVPFSSGMMTFIDIQHGWMLADLGVGAGSNAVAIFQSGDSGQNWTQMYVNDPTQSGAQDSLPLNGLKGELAAVDKKHAFVGGVVYSPGWVYLYETRDRGTSWVHRSLQLPPGAEVAELSIDQIEFFPQAVGYLVLRISGEESEKVIYATKNAGRTWTLTPMHLPAQARIDFISSTEAVFYSEDQFRTSTDALQTWTTSDSDTRFGDDFAGMDFIDTAHGWVITSDESGKRSLYRTTDAGENWIRLN